MVMEPPHIGHYRKYPPPPPPGSNTAYKKYDGDDKKLILPACRRLLFPLLNAKKGPGH